MSDETHDEPRETAETSEAPAGEQTAATADEQPLTTREGMRWYVLKVASNKENQVREALERKVKIEGLESRIGRVVVPTLKEKRLRGGQARIYHRKLYPGYVFVEMATEPDGTVPEDVWFLIKETTGVGDFISSGGKPSPMQEDDAEKMLKAALAEEETPALASMGFKKGDKVKVTEGPFENFEGLVDEVDLQKGTVRVIVTIFGRATPIEIEYWKIESV